MFGFIRIFKPYMRFCEYDSYKAVYCGLCKELGKSFGIMSRFTLSYDFTFLAMLDIAVNEKDISITKQRCIAHPVKKTVCASCTSDMSYTACAAVISIYHKLRDDCMDKGLKKKVASHLVLPFIKKHYRKAKSLYPELADVVETQMKRQTEIERNRCTNLDLAGEPTALIMSAIAGQISDDTEKKENLARLGYLLGRYVYFCDALADLTDDYKKGNYNPLVLSGITDITDNSQKDKVKEIATDTVNMTLGEIANTFVSLDIQKYRPVFDNIIYLGLKNTFSRILLGDYEKEK